MESSRLANDNCKRSVLITIGCICKRNVVVAPKGETIVDAAKRMRLLHVSTVIVAEERDGKQVPVGILTDRDIVLSIAASDADHLPFLSRDSNHNPARRYQRRVTWTQTAPGEIAGKTNVRFSRSGSG